MWRSRRERNTWKIPILPKSVDTWKLPRRVCSVGVRRQNVGFNKQTHPSPVFLRNKNDSSERNWEQLLLIIELGNVVGFREKGTPVTPTTFEWQVYWGVKACAECSCHTYISLQTPPLETWNTYWFNIQDEVSRSHVPEPKPKSLKLRERENISITRNVLVIPSMVLAGTPISLPTNLLYSQHSWANTYKVRMESIP